MKRLLAISVSMLMSFAALAQEKDVPFNGIVRFVNGEPVKGARIWVVKDLETRSDKKGRFGLTNVLPTDTITIRYKKMNYKVPVDGRKSIKIELLAEDSYTLGNIYDAPELANLGMGYVKRRELCTPSSGISGEVIRRSGATNLLDALAGRVPGLTINGNVVYIRGLGSINADPTPLYIVDGVRVPSLSNVPVDLVDNVEVLKDGSLYGMEGANGVIIVELIKGQYSK